MAIVARPVIVDVNPLVLSENAAEYACGKNCSRGRCEHIYKKRR